MFVDGERTFGSLDRVAELVVLLSERNAEELHDPIEQAVDHFEGSRLVVEDGRRIPLVLRLRV